VAASLGGAPVTVFPIERAKLSAIISCVRRSNATDPRDKVFTLHRLLSRIGADTLAVDYSKEISQVFEDMIATLVAESIFGLFRLMDVPSISEPISPK